MRDRACDVVCVHGAGGGGWEWAIWARVLRAQGRRVVAPDLRPGADGLAATTLADYRAQVLRWCADTPAPVLVGASLGGLLALSVAAAVGARALVLVNALPPWGLPAGDAPTPPVVRWRSARRFAGTRRALPDADAAARLYAFRRWRDESGRALDAARRGLACAPPACPTLVLASAADRDVPPAHGERLADLIDADFRLLADASHAGPLLGRDAARIAGEAAAWLDVCSV